MSVIAAMQVEVRGGGGRRDGGAFARIGSAFDMSGACNNIAGAQDCSRKSLSMAMNMRRLARPWVAGHGATSREETSMRCSLLFVLVARGIWHGGWRIA